MNRWDRGRGWWWVGLMAMLLGGFWLGALGRADDDTLREDQWQLPDDMIRAGTLHEASPILEVNFEYDAEKTPPLTVTRLTIKQGYAPQYDPLEAGYVLSLHAADGQTLSTLTFNIPNRVFDPPPQTGVVVQEQPMVFRKMEFTLTVPAVDGAVELRILDPQGQALITKSLLDVPKKTSHPNFRTRQQHGKTHEPTSSSSWQWLFPMETAEAATTDGTALDIVFVGDKYTAADLTLFHQDVDRVINHFLTYEPYTSRAQQILFHLVDNTTVDLGCVHDTTITRLITCNNTTVTTVVNDAGTPYDKIIVLVNDPNYGGSGGAIAVSYNGSSAPQVAVHEFGHTFGALLDEYNLYSTNGVSDGTIYANCYAGAPPASGWSALVAPSDYTVGCKYPNWYRSSSCSIMLSLSCPYFNAVSQQQLNAKLDLFAGSINPSVTLSASPTLVGIGGSSLLSWSAANVTSCIASGAWSGTEATSGTDSVIPSTTSNYILTCSQGTSSVTQTVTVTVDTQPPTVALTSPANGSTVAGTVTVAASAADDHGLNRVEFYKDNTLLGADNTSPFSLTWNTLQEINGPHTIVVKAVDAAGNVGTTAPATITVSNVVDTQAPVVGILSPAAGSQVTGKVKIQAAATDNVGVVRTTLYIDGVLKVSQTSSTVQMTWNTNNTTKGTHTITTKAFDQAGNVGSSSITVFR